MQLHYSQVVFLNPIILLTPTSLSPPTLPLSHYSFLPFSISPSPPFSVSLPSLPILSPFLSSLSISLFFFPLLGLSLSELVIFWFNGGVLMVGFSGGVELVARFGGDRFGAC